MALSIGTRLGPYEILGPLGAGGMGEVYRAKDTKLDREVAIKILPEALTHDAERLARFEREAKVLASLNHPNIAQIYAVEQNALVMEMVAGETLKGPLPVETALHYSSQIADALEAAHEKGIVHRDLKPANIMITPAGGVKVLDFGLAAVALASGSASSDPVNSPTLTLSPTRAGMILGTAAYMAPEQARGRPVDRRADIWAFGCVVYEMLAGKPLFAGETASDILAAVIKEEPALEAIPAHLRPAIEKCLRKDVRRRWRAAGDAQMALEEARPEDARTPAQRPRSLVGWALAAMLAAALIVSLVLLWPRPVDRPLMRLDVELGPGTSLTGPNSGSFAISPDGSRLVYGIKGDDGQVRLAVRRLDQGQASVLAGTEGARTPFFSPDGQWVGFNAAGKLKRISTQGGAAIPLCDAPNFRGAAWTEDGFIIAALDTQTPLVRVTETGGFYKPITELDKKAGEATHRWPQVLPGGKAVLFTSHTITGNYENATIIAQSLETGQRSVLWKGGSYGRYVPSGHLLFVHSGTLFAARMDAARLKLTGEPAPILESVAFNAVSGGAGFDFGRNSVLVFQAAVSSQRESMYWIRESAEPQLITTFPGAYSLRLAPDGRRAALSVSEGSSSEVWIYDLERDTRTRLTVGGSSSNPIWTPDGKNVAYVFQHGGSSEIQCMRADGAGEATRLYSSPNALQLGSFTPDSKRLVFAIQAAATGADLWTLPIEPLEGGRMKAGSAEVFLQTPFNEQDAEFSPDGKWIAYASAETGRQEVYVRPFPGPGGRWQISNGGGTFPVWSRNGRQLFYIGADRMMVAGYRVTGDSFAAEKPLVWSPREFINPNVYYRRFDVSGDGKRFVELRPLISEAEKAPTTVTFLLNFFDELRRRVPGGK